MRKIIKSKEIGFCYGVTRAINIAIDTVDNKELPRPIYLLGNLVHNHHINEYLSKIGITIIDGKSRLEMLDKINSGTVIFTAHGVSDLVIDKAKAKGLHIVNATCPYVSSVFNNLKEYSNKGYDALFIGKKHHPETEVALTIPNVYLAEEYSKENKSQKICICHQTTMSSFDVSEKLQELTKKYPQIEVIDMLCKVTEKRQLSLLKLENYEFKSPALIIVIGDSTSNNSTKLYEMAKRLNKTDVLFIDNISELNFQTLKKYNEIMLLSGTSTPEAITTELYELLLNLDNITENIIISKLESKNYIL